MKKQMKWLLNFISPDSGKRYSLLQKHDGTLHCTCLACRYSVPHTCKHIAAFNRFGRPA